MSQSEQEQGILSIPDDWEERYITAMKAACTLIDPVTKKQIPLHYPTERAFSDTTSKVKIKGVEEKRGTLTLPHTTLVHVDTNYDPNRRGGGRFRKLQYSSDFRRVYGMKYPEPYDLVFQYDIRSKYNAEDQRLRKVFHQNKIEHGAFYLRMELEPFGKQNFVRVEVDGPTDASELEPGDNRDRTIRKTYTLTVKAWMFDEPYKVPTAITFHFDAKDSSTGEILDSYEYDRNGNLVVEP